ncbi:CDP-alcohol phosphatidyltransferase family protein [Legionella sp. PC1000]|uniref:CDP-alcohol phosphatidyltransferase family protein n=1 Tax=Legionella sp. PC1000 TaxID=2746060 RepID=UPI0015FBB5FB|nr:CDP-alcohol phosphatidyltransferase family protein [Legionella sp. PC1000]QLZ68629.1 CDP-alcohol phosphatidyltransferase family protein [Legionella sp. PC1000]
MIKEKSRTWQKTSMFLGKFFAKYSPFPAGFYTINSLILATVAVFYSYSHYYITAILLFLLAGIFDVIDGSVARARNKASNLGAFVDGTIDRFVDFAIIFSYFFCEIKAFYLSLDQLICITSFVVILPSFIVAYANHRGAVSDDNETLIWRVMNRGEMLFFMIGILITSLFSSYWAGVLLLLLIFLSTFTIIQTIFLTIYHASKHKSA